MGRGSGCVLDSASAGGGSAAAPPSSFVMTEEAGMREGGRAGGRGARGSKGPAAAAAGENQKSRVTASRSPEVGPSPSGDTL